MDLVLFDIDGTLIRSMAEDGECLVIALQEVFGLADIQDDWACYEHSTDAGIASEAFLQRKGRLPWPDEVADFCARFAELLAERCAAQPLQEVPGASRLLADLQAREDIAVAFATGCFRRTAAVKMKSAGLEFEKAVSATCDDAIARVEIMRIAIARAASHCGISRFENTVNVGDAIWDVQACRELVLPFIGVTADKEAERLRRAGARFLLADFTDQGLFHRYRQQCNAQPASDVV